MLRLASLLLALGLSTPTALAGPTAGVPRGEVVITPHADPPPVPDDWVTLARPGLTITGDVAHSRTLERMADHATEALPRLAEALGVPVGGRIHAVLAPDDAAFHALQPGAPPDWADATAWPGRGWIFLRHPAARSGTARPLTQVLDHELVHVLLGRAFAPAPVPAWLQEGAAQVLAGEAGPELPGRLRRAMATTGTQPRVQDLVRGFPADPARAQLAYAASADLIHFLRRTWGEDALRRLVRAGGAGKGLDAALVDVTGNSLEVLEARWHATLPGVAGSALSPEVMDSALFGGAAALVGGLGTLRLIRRRRTHRSTREEAAAIRRAARQILARRRQDPA